MRPLNQLLLIALMSSGAYLGNSYLALPIGYSLHFIFGSIFSLFTAVFLPRYAIFIVCFFSAIGTNTLWGHPYAIPVHLLEAIALFVATTSRLRGAIFLTMISYWAVAPTLAGLLLYKYFITDSFSTAFSIMIKQSANGIVNTLIAGLVSLTIWSLFRSKIKKDDFKFGLPDISALFATSVIPIPLIFLTFMQFYFEYKSNILKGLTSASTIAQAAMTQIEREVSFIEEETSLLFFAEDATNIYDFLQTGPASERFSHIFLRDSIGNYSQAKGDDIDNEILDSIYDQTNVDGFSQIFMSSVVDVAGEEVLISVYRAKIGSVFLAWEKSYFQSIINKEINSIEDILLVNQIVSKLEIGNFSNTYLALPEQDIPDFSANTVTDWNDQFLSSHAYSKLIDGIRVYVAVAHKPYIDRYYASPRPFISIIYGSLLLLFVTSYYLATYILKTIKKPFDYLLSDPYHKAFRGTEMQDSFVIEVSAMGHWLNDIIQTLQSQSTQQKLIAHDLRRLIDTANAPIFGIDDQGRINEWNQAAARITGYSTEEVMGEDLVSKYITEDYRRSVKEVLDKALSGEETENYEFPLYTKSGDRVDVLLNSTTRRDQNGYIVGVVGVGQDITAVKKSQEQLIHSSKLATLGEMTTGIAHELNQPLNVIKLAVYNIEKRLENKTLEDEYLFGKVRRISNQVERAAQLIDRMRVFGRKPTEDPAPFSVAAALIHSHDMIAQQMKLAGIEVEFHFDDSKEFTAIGHPILLEQVFLNLFSNAKDAIDATHPKEKSIRVTLTFCDENVVIIFSDTGGGIEPSIMSRIFEPFYTTKEIGSGTGLGLSVSYGIITDLGGTMEVMNIEEGAQFTITLPIGERT